MINKEEFMKMINHEIEWLRYYAWKGSREKLTINSNLYEELISIGYAKRKVPLDNRCPYCILTSNNLIKTGIKIEELYIAYKNRNNDENYYTPLEIYWILYPEERNNIIKKLNQ